MIVVGHGVFFQPCVLIVAYLVFLGRRGDMDYLFAPRALPSVAIVGDARHYSVSRIFCVGRNYAEHAAEMGAEVDREAPFYFTKSMTALSHGETAWRLPPGTQDCHHEVELVVALAAPLYRAAPETAMAAVYGYAVGLDMTRRDLQADAKAKRRPWDLGKDFEGSAIVGKMTPAARCEAIEQAEIALSCHGELRQRSSLSQMIWSVSDILCHLSTYYHLAAGDLIFTGTPAGVAAVKAGDQ